VRNNHILTLLTIGTSIFLIAVCSFAYAAAADGSDQQAPSTAFIIAVGLFFNGAANIGSIIFFVKKYVAKVDKTDDTLPSLIATLESTKRAMDQHARSIEELYSTRNNHNIKLARIETIYRLRGCDKGLELGIGGSVDDKT